MMLSIPIWNSGFSAEIVSRGRVHRTSGIGRQQARLRQRCQEPYGDLRTPARTPAERLPRGNQANRLVGSRDGPRKPVAKPEFQLVTIHGLVVHPTRGGGRR